MPSARPGGNLRAATAYVQAVQRVGQRQFRLCSAGAARQPLGGRTAGRYRHAEAFEAQRARAFWSVGAAKPIPRFLRAASCTERVCSPRHLIERR
jgi:hypothetical protein